MARPKGSKNGVRKKSGKKEVLAKEIKEGVPPVSKKDSAATTSDSFVVKPDMGGVQSSLVCECEHGENFHYGGLKKWCNVPNCRCQAWTQK